MMNQHIYRLLLPIFALLTLFAGSAAAQKPSAASATAEQVSQALGLPELIAAAKQRNLEASNDQFEIALSQMAKSGMPNEIVVEMRARSAPMLARINDSWNESEAARIYATEIASALTAEELDAALAYYSTEEGRNTYAAIESGEAKMRNYISTRTAESMKQELADWMAQIRQLAKEYQAKKK